MQRIADDAARVGTALYSYNLEWHASRFIIRRSLFLSYSCVDRKKSLYMQQQQAYIYMMLIHQILVLAGYDQQIKHRMKNIFKNQKLQNKQSMRLCEQ